MKSFFEEYCRIIGLLLLVFVIIFLLSSPSTLFAKTITTIDTELSHASGDAVSVRAKMDLGNNEHMRAFPNNICGWVGSEYNTTRVAESLDADVMLMRNYVNPETFQPVSSSYNQKTTQAFTLLSSVILLWAIQSRKRAKRGYRCGI